MATITRFIIRIFLSPRALFPLSLVGIYRGPRRILLLPILLLPFHERFSSISPPRPPLSPFAPPSLSLSLSLSLSFYRRVHIVALPVVSNRRFEFLNIFRLPAPLCPSAIRVLPPVRSLSDPKTLFSLAPRYYLLCRCLIETVIVFSDGSRNRGRRERERERRSRGGSMILKYLSPGINLVAAVLHT